MSSGHNGRPETRRRLLKTMGAAGVVAAAGCIDDEPPAADDTAPDSDDTDVADTDLQHWIGVHSSEAPNRNVFTITDTTSAANVARVKDNAYTINDQNEFVPRLIRDYDHNDDYTEWRFELTEHAYWSDPYGGLTAHDYEYSIKNVLQGGEHGENWAGAADYQRWFIGDEPIEAEATGDYELTLRLPEPRPGFLLVVPMSNFNTVMPRELIEPYYEEADADGLDQDDEVQNLSYTGNLGGFTVEEIEIESRIHFVRNDDYYLTNYDGYEDWPNWDEWTYEILSEESTRLAALQADEITATGIPENRYEEFATDENLQVYQIDDPFIFGAPIFNMRAGHPEYPDAWEGAPAGWEPLADAKIRRAICHAIDKEAMVEGFFGGMGQVVHTMMPPHAEFYDDSQVTPHGEGDSYDKDLARDMLDEHLPQEYGYNDAERVVDGDGEEVVLTLVCSEGSDSQVESARFIGQELDGIGLEVDVEVVPWNTMLDEYAYFVDGAGREWDLMTGINRNAYPLDPTGTADFWNPDAYTGANFYGYDDPHGVHEMLNEAESTTSQAERAEIIAEALGILSEEVPYNFGRARVSIDAYQDYVNINEPHDGEPFHQSWPFEQYGWEFETQ